jgi:glutamyl-tRNA reductase
MEQSTSLIAIGISHRTAPAEVRGQLAGKRIALNVAETVVLSTCNRFEVYAASSDATRARAEIEGALCSAAPRSFERIRPALYSFEGREAARHLMHVAAGLDSMVLGETQILGQVSQSLAGAEASKSVGPVLSRLFGAAIHAARLAHRYTGMNGIPTSVGHAAACLLKSHAGDLAKRNILLVGAGPLSRLTARSLRKSGAHSLAFINRTESHARAAAAPLGSAVFRWEELSSALSWADAVVAATGANEPVLRKSDLQRRAVAERPLCIVDLGVPRNVEPGLSGLKGVLVFGIDELDSSLDQNLARRRAAVPEIERLLAGKVDEFMKWWASRSVTPLIADLRRKVEHVARTELQLALSSGVPLDADQRQVVARLVYRVTNKLLHEPTLRLKEKHASAHIYQDAIRDLFALGEGEARC